MTIVQRSPSTAMLRAIAQCSVARASWRTARGSLPGFDGVGALLAEAPDDQPAQQLPELLDLAAGQAPEEALLDDGEERLLRAGHERVALGGDRRVHDPRVARAGAARGQPARLQRVDHARHPA